MTDSPTLGITSSRQYPPAWGGDLEFGGERMCHFAEGPQKGERTEAVREQQVLEPLRADGSAP